MVKSFEEVISLLCDTQCLDLTPGHDEAISYPDENKIFVEPDLSQLTDFNGSSPFIVISAPGATGKSILGREISNRKKTIFWDLSKTNIGDNYFIGTLTNSFGVSNLANIVQKIHSNDFCFIIDSFDEAEISSGWNRVEAFIKEIHSFVSTNTRASVVLLSRSETAQYICMALDELVGENYYHYYSINFFDTDKSKELLLKYVEDKNPESMQHRAKIVEISDKIFNGIRAAFQGEAHKSNLKCFSGYAPVIQAIAILITQYHNLQELDNTFDDETKYTDIIDTIICNILEREQNKFLSSFRSRLEALALGTENITNLYSPREQIFRLLKLINSNNTIVHDYDINDGIGANVIQAYQKALNNFIPQHPFLKDNDNFASPAFNDYCWAKTLNKDNVDDQLERNAYSSLMSITPLFWDFYLSGQLSRVIKSRHIGFMFESALSSKDSSDEVIAAVYDIKENGEANFTTILNVACPEEEQSIINEKVLLDEIGLVFPYHAKNIAIDSTASVILGVSDNEFNIINATIRSSNITFRSKIVNIRCNELDKPITLIADTCEYPQSSFNLNKIGAGNLLINWENGEQYPWAEYYRDIQDLEKPNIDNAFLALRQILKWFRKDRKDAIARYADFIRNVAINKNKLNDKLLDYLLETGVLWQDGGLYKLSHKKAGRHGMNFNALKNMAINDELNAFLTNFCRTLND